MKKCILFLTVFCFLQIKMFAQEANEPVATNWQRYLHLESGFVFPNGSLNEDIPIRQNFSHHYDLSSRGGEVTLRSSGSLLGLRFEFFNPKYQAGISTGIRYTNYSSLIKGSSSSNAEFFYLRYVFIDDEAKYARVKSISETNNFIGIPIELRYIPLQTKYVGLILKTGFEISFLNISPKTTIELQETSMEQYESQIIDNVIRETDKYYSTLYSSIGVNVGKPDKPKFIFEVFLPSYYLTKNNFALMNEVNHYKGGVKFSIQFPISKAQQ